MQPRFSSLFSRVPSKTPVHTQRWASGLLALMSGFALITSSPSLAQDASAASSSDQARSAQTRGLAHWQSVAQGLHGQQDLFERMSAAHEIAQAIADSGESERSLATTLAARVDTVIAASYPNLGRYPGLERVHGHEEPTWLEDRGDATAQAVLASAALESWKSDPLRRKRMQELANGLAALQRKDRLEYPFGAHLGWEDWEPMVSLDDGTRVPATYYQVERAYAVQALAEASALLNDENLLLSAEREALGMSTHLVIAGRPLDSFSPQPEYSNAPEVALPLVKGFLALYRTTDKKIYADLAALGTIWNEGKAPSGESWRKVVAEIGQTPGKALLSAKPSGEPISFQVIEAEDGKVVNKAIETVGFQSPSGQRGALASMGRENTFWMRFDVPTEDDYVFYLTYLQSDIGGGLVSVMMRIDGDKIFQVSLGDVDGRPIMRRKFVDGPRPLRAGPHSFGIRFSGLLMTKPALLDSVIVQPAIERREFTTPTGDRLVLMRNVTGEVARTDKAAFLPWPAKEELVLNGDGKAAKLGQSEDRRRRKQFLTLPAYGVALLRLAPTPAEGQ